MSDSGMDSFQAPLIKGFAFRRFLGAGGFAHVYLYTQDYPHRSVALKVVDLDQVRSGRPGAALTRFEREANTLAQLSAHPNVMTLYDIGVTISGQPFTVLEYCPFALSDLQPGDLGVSEVLAICVQIAGALETAHQAGIVHGDVRPGNIVVSQYGVPLLTDFGGPPAGRDDFALSEELKDADGGESVIEWSSPEAVWSADFVSRLSDIWSLAATIYGLLVGHSPFVVNGGDNSYTELSRRIQRSALPHFDAAQIPVPLQKVLRKAMSKRPKARYASMREFALALQKVQERLGYPVTGFVAGLQNDLVLERDGALDRQVSLQLLQDLTKVGRPVAALSGRSAAEPVVGATAMPTGAVGRPSAKPRAASHRPGRLSAWWAAAHRQRRQSAPTSSETDETRLIPVVRPAVGPLTAAVAGAPAGSGTSAETAPARFTPALAPAVSPQSPADLSASSVGPAAVGPAAVPVPGQFPPGRSVSAPADGPAQEIPRWALNAVQPGQGRDPSGRSSSQPAARPKAGRRRSREGEPVTAHGPRRPGRVLLAVGQILVVFAISAGLTELVLRLLNLL